MTIKQSQLRDTLDFNILLPSNYNQSWEDNTTLNSIRNEISHYWYLNESSTPLSPLIGGVDFTAVGGSAGIAYGRAPSPLSESSVWMTESSTYYLITDDAVGPSTNNYSLWLWYRLETITNPYESILDWDYTASGNRAGVYQEDDRLVTNQTSGTANNFLDSTGQAIITRPETNRWILYVVTVNSTDMTLYLSGSLLGTATTTLTDLSSSKLVLGRRWSPAINGIKGSVCHVGLMNDYVLNPNEIGLMWNQGLGRFPTAE